MFSISVTCWETVIMISRDLNAHSTMFASGNLARPTLVLIVTSRATLAVELLSQLIEQLIEPIVRLRDHPAMSVIHFSFRRRKVKRKNFRRDVSSCVLRSRWHQDSMLRIVHWGYKANSRH